MTRKYEIAFHFFAALGDMAHHVHVHAMRDADGAAAVCLRGARPSTVRGTYNQERGVSRHGVPQLARIAITHPIPSSSPRCSCSTSRALETVSRTQHQTPTSTRPQPPDPSRPSQCHCRLRSRLSAHVSAHVRVRYAPVRPLRTRFAALTSCLSPPPRSPARLSRAARPAAHGSRRPLAQT